VSETSALRRLLADRIEKLRDDPKQLEKTVDLLYDIVQKKVVMEHNADMAMVLAMLYRFTKTQQDQTQHQIVLGLFVKYGIPVPNDVTITPGQA
jgi:hypothetical protein